MGLRYDEPASGPPVATDRGADDQNYQVEKMAFGSGGSPADIVRVDFGQPLPARDYHGGSAALDTGRVEVAASSTLITPGNDVWCDLLLLINLTDQVQALAVADGGDNSYGEILLQPKEWRPLPLGGLLFSGGIKLAAAAVNSALAQFKGTQ